MVKMFFNTNPPPTWTNIKMKQKRIQMQRFHRERNDRVYNKSDKYPKWFSNEQEKNQSIPYA